MKKAIIIAISIARQTFSVKKIGNFSKINFVNILPKEPVPPVIRIDLLFKSNINGNFYKFYLFDHKLEQPFINCWIGPNKKDSLNQKLKKLKENQLPLLHHNITRQLLEHHGLFLEDIKQRIILKAQLFVPEDSILKYPDGINREAIAGIHLKISQLNKYSKCKFFIPTKHDWLIAIQENVKWVSFDIVYPKIVNFHGNCISPMVWIKFHSGQLLKCFVTWW